MRMVEYSESLQMLKSKEGQLNAVFACFGSAAQHSQLFEEALASLLLLYNRIADRSLKVEDLDAIEEKLQRKTMGALLTEFKRYVKVNEAKVEGLMALALEKRNFLIHQYFRARTAKFYTLPGRMEMLEELVGIGNILEKAARLTNGMRIAIECAVGFSLTSDDFEVVDFDKQSPTLFAIEIDVPTGVRGNLPVGASRRTSG